MTSDKNNQAERPDLWLTETTTPGLLVQTDLNSGETEPVFAGAATQEEYPWGKPLELDPEDYPNFELRRYDPRPQCAEGVTIRCSNDFQALLKECQSANRQSLVNDGFEQYCITDRGGEIIYPLRVPSRLYPAPVAEQHEVLQPFVQVQAIPTAQALHDFLFLTRDVDETQRHERLQLLATEMERTVSHIRQLLSKAMDVPRQQPFPVPLRMPQGEE